MNLTLSTSSGKLRSEIKNIESYPLDKKLTVSCAEYEVGTGAVVFLEAPNHVEFIDTFETKGKARIYCKQSTASYDGREGVVEQ